MKSQHGFHVNELDELQFAGGSASDLTVPEFNQVMREADGRIQKIESNIDAAVRFLEAKLRDNPEQKKFRNGLAGISRDAAVWEFCMQDSYRPADEHIELSLFRHTLASDVPGVGYSVCTPRLPRGVQRESRQRGKGGWQARRSRART